MSFDVDKITAEHANKQAKAKILQPSTNSTTGNSNINSHSSSSSPSKHVGDPDDVDDQINALYMKLNNKQEKPTDSSNTSPPKYSSSVASGSNVDGNSSSSGRAAGESAADNAARVDALLMELFPERMKEDKKKAKLNAKGKGGKQAYGIGAVNNSKAHDIAHYINAQSHNHQPSRYSGAEGGSSALSPLHDSGVADSAGGGGGGGDMVLTSLESQMRLLRRELKGKDDKLARVTEHSVMLAAHMDRLKGEV